MAARQSDGEYRNNHENKGFWSIDFGGSPVIGTAIHDGHRIRPDVSRLMALSPEQRLREEDPFTGEMIAGLTNRIVVHHSRFEIDLNRAADQAIYLKPEQSWGLEVWKEEPAQEAVRQSLDFHADYYTMLETMLSAIERRHGAFVVLDIHSYNHRRQGAAAPPTAQAEAPDINIGTFSLDRSRWGDIVSAVGRHFASATIGERHLDVRENVAFQGKGEQTRFIHERFAENGCAIAIEFKKFFMDEWTGKPDERVVADIRQAIAALQPVIEECLRSRR
ncbi:N-formylglutamate amidohydrolase [Agrobacterium salinitolerans]|uniref:N-formylglutamate amidohydrolase n=1 Tax=Agrobacterium salinitolerans TaxID=1183413 RepID=UPI0009902BF5|nr:N-formylglutamate amidohydrolase [Agrobacterium salinitolerans]OOO16985.1 N-formylglutamate amidohydrolase [Agrobacterium salinitolerans]PNQ20939.1 N-formylglutamate amidohydrolase [Rhizobium sp. YIC5082]